LNCYKTCGDEGCCMRLDGLDFAPRRFSTTKLAERHRIPFWCDVFGRQVVRLNIESRSDDPLEADAVIRALPGLRSASFVSKAAHLERPLNMVADGDDAVVLLVSERGTLAASQRGRDVSLRSGYATLLLHGEPSAVTHAQIRFQGLIVPRAPVAALVTAVEDAAMRPVARSNAALRLLMSYLKTISRDPPVQQPDLCALAVSHVHDLVAMILGAHRDGAAIAEDRGVAAAKLAAIKADIIERIGLGDVRIEAVAARQGVTPRSIQRLFEREGSTFSTFKLEHQLACARRMLRNSQYGGWTIGDIALAAGFGDLSYFHRVFRRRFGATPADMRTVQRESRLQAHR
jgi:AraC-like DNA-binding protein